MKATLLHDQHYREERGKEEGEPETERRPESFREFNHTDTNSLGSGRCSLTLTYG